MVSEKDKIWFIETFFCRRECSLSIWSLRRSGADDVSSLNDCCSSIWFDCIVGEIIGLDSNGDINVWLI